MFWVEYYGPKRWTEVDELFHFARKLNVSRILWIILAGHRLIYCANYLTILCIKKCTCWRRMNTARSIRYAKHLKRLRIMYLTILRQNSRFGVSDLFVVFHWSLYHSIDRRTKRVCNTHLKPGGRTLPVVCYAPCQVAKRLKVSRFIFHCSVMLENSKLKVQNQYLNGTTITNWW